MKEEDIEKALTLKNKKDALKEHISWLSKLANVTSVTLEVHGFPKDSKNEGKNRYSFTSEKQIFIDAAIKCLEARLNETNDKMNSLLNN